MKSLPKFCLVGISLLVVGASLVHPSGPVKGTSSSLALFAGTGEPPEIARIVNRACQNCHSERTEWPWYSYVAPMSWLIEKDVSSARTHMNLSHWQDYSVDQRIDLLTRLAVEVRNRKMPLPKYLKIHAEATLTDDDVQQLYSWAHNERRRLKAADVKGKASTD
jgi:Haem-binding domain